VVREEGTNPSTQDRGDAEDVEDMDEMIRTDMIKEALDVEEEEGHGEAGGHGGACRVYDRMHCVSGTVVIA
jgi:glycerate kinase